MQNNAKQLLHPSDRDAKVDLKTPRYRAKLILLSACILSIQSHAAVAENDSNPDLPYAPVRWSNESLSVITMFPGEPSVQKMQSGYATGYMAQYLQEIDTGTVVYQVIEMPGIGMDDVNSEFALEYTIEISASMYGENIVDPITTTLMTMPGGMVSLEYSYSYLVQDIHIFTQGKAVLIDKTMIDVSAKTTIPDDPTVERSIDFFINSAMFLETN